MIKPENLRGPLSAEPSGEFAAHQMLDHAHALGAGIETRNMGEVLAAIVGENLANLSGNCFQRLDAIGLEAGVDDGD